VVEGSSNGQARFKQMGAWPASDRRGKGERVPFLKARADSLDASRQGEGVQQKLEKLS